MDLKQYPISMESSALQGTENVCVKVQRCEEACITYEPTSTEVSVKIEPLDDVYVKDESKRECVYIKAEPSYSDVSVKDESAGVSAATGLYSEYAVKDELVLGPVLMERRVRHAPTAFNTDIEVKQSRELVPESTDGDSQRQVPEPGVEELRNTKVGKAKRNKQVVTRPLREMETSADAGSMSPARVRQEAETDRSEMPLIKEEAGFMDEEARVKEECEDSTDGCGVSEAAVLAGLYDEHVVKDELVLGPERPHRPTVAPVVRAPTLVSSAVVSGRRRSCSVRLERLLVDAERRTCRVGRRTYKLHATEPAPTPHVTTTIYQCHHCGKRFRSKSVLKKHVHNYSPLHNSTVGDYGLERHQMLHGDKKLYEKAHMIIHTGEKPFRCKYCGYESSRKSNLRTHLITHTDDKPFSCSHCSYKCKRKSDLQSHLMTHTDEKPFRCTHCDHKSRTKAHLRIHLMTHSDEKPFNCSHCDYKCRRKAHLHKHLMTHTDEKPFSCSHCSYKCRSKADLQQHLMTHTDEKPFSCSHCGYKCRRKAQLRKHLMTHTDEKPFSCSDCSYKCRSKVDLQRHLMTHTDEKPFSCSHCSYKCRSKADLQRHLMTHTDEKPFSCSHCGYKCRRKTHLRKHLMTHTDEKPFSCSHCGYKCRRKTQLRKHLMSHTDEKLFSCSHCSYKCRSKADLQTHLMARTDEKPFRCKHCAYNV
ncbi:gastrula zinc finger protein XlCGF58.1-like isoform X1 [Cydia splendana]|uniref:gastrula zinc finger protein XlCGF58.1-like isoform X1 n=1 Tax=Cydia splendana TaxID=1100963 RepID=UPI00300C2731